MRSFGKIRLDSGVRKAAAVALVACMLVAVANGQNKPVLSDSVSADSLEQTGAEYLPSDVHFFSLDHAALRYSEDKLLLEVYAMIDRASLASQEVDGEFQAAYLATIQVLDGRDSLVAGDQWTATSTVANLDEAVAGKKIPELVRFAVDAGDYHLQMRVIDLVGKVYHVSDYHTTLAAIPQDSLAISDIILASKVEQAEGDVGVFDHNGLLVLPNAERMFGTNNSQVFYYSEIYGLSKNGNAHYTVRREILNQQGEVVKTLKERERTANASNLVETGAFTINTLRSGAYTIKISVEDDASGMIIAKERPFWVFRMDEKIQFVAMPNVDFDINALTDEEVDEELRAARNVMSSKIQARVSKLKTIDTKRNFLAHFWAAMDPDTTNEINEARINFLRRLDTVNERFGGLQTKGWLTDRGRIYLRYGEPDHIDKHPFDQDVAKAYEVWEYDNLEGGVSFVFVDRNGYGDYSLVHSTKRGEMFNPNWKNSELGRVGGY